MSYAVTLDIKEAQGLVERSLTAAGLAAGAARSTARALVGAECDGQKGHGLSRVSSYVEQITCGKVNKDAKPSVRRLTDAACIIDADFGFAYPAIDLAIEELATLAKSSVVALAAVRHSHHFGQAGAHVERLAERGLVAFLFGNSPKAMAFWGGARPMIGTNPIAFAAPMRGSPALVIDLALSVAARGKVMAAAKAGKPIPPDWALDAAGKPTTDAGAALKGSMAPAGGAKGAALALMIEIVAAAITSSSFGFEASSFLDGEGPPPDMGHVFIAIDPERLSGGDYWAKMATLAAAMGEEASVRPPGLSRLNNRRQAEQSGLLIPAALAAEMRKLAGAGQ